MLRAPSDSPTASVADRRETLPALDRAAEAQPTVRLGWRPWQARRRLARTALRRLRRWPSATLAAAALALGAGVIGWAIPHPGQLDPPAAPAYDLGTIVPPYNVALADPFVLVGKKLDYLYTSAASTKPPNVPVRPFTSLDHLGPETDAMPKLPPWTSGWIWAPDVRRVEGHYVMWFAAPDIHDVLDTGQPAKCLGVATARSPLGPFVARPKPVFCGRWGEIDPRTFVAPDGQLWLDWKADVNASWGPAQNPSLAANQPTTLWAQRLAPNDLALEGPRYRLLTATQPWEHKLIEAPDMVSSNGRYYLFFSANPSYGDNDGVAVADCRGPAGPCREPYAGPLVGSDALGLGPGEESLFTQAGATWLLYSPTGVTFARQIAVSRIAFGPGGPYVAAFAGAVPGVH